MYGNNRKKSSKKGKKKTSKQYAFLAGYKAGLRMARKNSGRTRSKRWY